MVKIRLIYLLKMLSKEEIDKLGKYAEIFFPSRGVIYKVIVTHCAEAISSGIEKYSTLKFTEMLSKKTGLKKQSLYNRFSELSKITENYLLHLENQSSEEKRSIELMRAFKSKNADVLFNSEYERFMKYCSEKPFSANNLGYLKEATEMKAYFYFQTNQYSEYTKLHLLMRKYAVNEFMKYMYTCEIEVSQQRTYNTEKEKTIASRITNSVDFEKIAAGSAESGDVMTLHTEFLYHLSKVFSNMDDYSHFSKAEDIFWRIKDKTSRYTTDEMYFLMITYCINLTNNGRHEYFAKLFEMVSTKIKDGFTDDLKYYNYPVNNFRDYVIIAIRAGKSDWAEEFIDRYSILLPEPLRQNESLVCKGIIYFRKGEHEKSLRMFEAVKSKIYLHYTDSATYKMMIYYELERLDDGLVQAKNLKEYIKVHKEIPDLLKKTLAAFIKEYLILIKAAVKMDKSYAGYNLNFLRKLPFSYNRSWVIKRLESLAGK